MSRRGSSSPATPANTPAERLQESVEQLAENVRVLTDIVDQIREDLSWLTRNGLPHQPLIVQVQRMPLLSAGDRGSFEFSLLSLPTSDPTAETLGDDQLREAAIDQLVGKLAEPLGQIAQEQLNVLMSVLDHAHRDVLQAIRSPQSLEPTGPKPRRRRKKKPAEPESEVPPSGNVPTRPPAMPPPPGQLF